jgi:polysaccharide export outer membrane protein
MTRRKINKLIAVLLSAVLLASPVFSEELTGKALGNDIAYYRKVAREKKLDLNGRNYILRRIEDKYRGSDVNLSPLKQELRKLKQKNTPAGRKSTAAKKTTARASGGTAKQAVQGTLKKITVIDTDTVTRITVFSPGTERTNYFLLKDPEPGELTKLVLDLYGTVTSLEGNEKTIEEKEGVFARVRVGQFKDPPDPIVRVVVEMRQMRPYRILRDKDTWTIVAEKEAKEGADQSTPATPSAPLEQPAYPQKQEQAMSMPATEPPPVPAASLLPAAKTAAADATDPDTGAGYLIETGDVLGVTVFPADELSREVIVQSDGNVPFPLIGRAKAKGLTTKQLETEMAKSLGRYIAHPTVTIAVKQFSKRQLFITGEVRSVGTFTYKNKLRLLEFISSVGGFTESANRKEIKVYRGTADKRQTFNVDLEEVIRSGNFANDFPLEPGDIVEVPQGRARIAVLGDVRNPGYYDYRDNLHLVELISLAGGFTDTAELKKVRILHASGVNEQKAQNVNLKEILSGKTKDFAVQNGDTVYVPKGNIANANWFITNILPWVSLVSLVLVIRGGI